MDKTNEKYNAYIQILKEELIPCYGMYRADRSGFMQQQLQEKYWGSCLRE